MWEGDTVLCQRKRGRTNEIVTTTVLISAYGSVEKVPVCGPAAYAYPRRSVYPYTYARTKAGREVSAFRLEYKSRVDSEHRETRQMCACITTKQYIPSRSKKQESPRTFFFFFRSKCRKNFFLWSIVLACNYTLLQIEKENVLFWQRGEEEKTHQIFQTFYIPTGAYLFFFILMTGAMTQKESLLLHQWGHRVNYNMV